MLWIILEKCDKVIRIDFIYNHRLVLNVKK